MDTQKIAKAISLMNSMILGSEQHSTQSIKIMREAMEEVDKQQVSVKPEVKPACKHNFQIAKRDYYKPTGQIGSLGVMTYNQERTYSMLFCTKCGETKEIITS